MKGTDTLVPCCFTEKHNERSSLPRALASLWLCLTKTVLLDSSAWPLAKEHHWDCKGYISFTQGASALRGCCADKLGKHSAINRLITSARQNRDMI